MYPSDRNDQRDRTDGCLHGIYCHYFHVTRGVVLKHETHQLKLHEPWTISEVLVDIVTQELAWGSVFSRIKIPIPDRIMPRS